MTEVARWTTAELDALKAECMKRHLLDPIWQRIADAIGSLQFDKVDAEERGREMAAAYAAMREALPAHDSCCDSMDTHLRDALGRQPDCDCDIGRILAQPLPSLAAKVAAVVNEARSAIADLEADWRGANKFDRSPLGVPGMIKLREALAALSGPSDAPETQKGEPRRFPGHGSPR